MNNIYEPPQSNLIEIESMNTPREVFICLFLLSIESLLSLTSNFTPSFGEEALGIATAEGLIVIVITILILAYFYFLLLSRKRAITL